MNKRLQELVSTDRRFQSSVNLMLDIANENKIESYIPTRSSLGILSQYLYDTEKESHGNATVLIGPYGKGKSHLILVWLSLLAGKKNPKKDALIEKICEVDSDTGALAKEIYDSERKYLPVLVSNTDSNLNQAFLISLYEALQQAHLSKIVPDSYYSEAIKVIDTWKKKFSAAYNQLEELLAKEKYDVKSFKARLKNYDKSALTYFRKIYPQLTAGSRFEPILQQEALKVYQSINRELKDTYGYDGIVIVFDEFSKYIEGHGKENFASDMRVLQEMCELAAGSKIESGKIQLVLIAHKSIKEYGTRLDAVVRKEYEGVEGRLQERLFVISGQNNYELIKSTIKKASSTSEVFNNEGFVKMVKKNYELQLFRSIFENEEDFKRIIAEGCFPLRPLTAYILLGISEKVAQNERTIFTFLCYDEFGSLTNIIAKHKKGQQLLISADAVYDYFEIQFKENIADAFIHNEWLKSDYALSKCASEDEEKVIKTIALIHMIGHQEELIADTRTIELAVGELESSLTDVIDNLVEKQLIVYRSRTNQYAFKHNVGINLDSEIKNRIAGLQNRYSISEVVAEIAEMDYLLPRRHNQSFKMTRFFRYIYLTEEEFLALPDINTLISGDNFADGCIVAVLLQDEVRRQECINKAETIVDKRAVVVVPCEQLDLEELIQKYVVIKELLSSKDFLSQHQVMKLELTLQQEDVVYEINNELDKLLTLNESACSVFNSGEEVENLSSMTSFNNLLSRICDEYYKDTPIINHELINIRRVSGQYLKARNIVINGLLNGDDMDSFISGTSPESMVFRSALLYTGIYPTKDKYIMNPGTKAAIAEIHKFFKKSVGEKRSFEKLFTKLQGKGFGMRKGVIPIYIASQLVTLSNMPVIYLMDKEVDVSAEILNNLCDKPEEYFLYIEEKDACKDKYLEDLERLFIDEDFSRRIQGKHKRLSTLVGAIQRWYRSLPQCAVNFESDKGRYTQEELEHIKGIRNIFRKIDVNPREILFDSIPELLSENRDYDQCAKNIKRVRNILDNYKDLEMERAVSGAEEALGLDSLASGLINWYRNKSDAVKKYINSSRVSQMMNYLSELTTYDNKLVASDLSKILIDLYIEDWRDDSLDMFIEALTDAINTVDNIGSESDSNLGEYTFMIKDSSGDIIERNYDFSDDSTSYFLKNAIESALDDFGDSLETNQKVAVLVQTIEQLIKQK